MTSALCRRIGVRHKSAVIKEGGRRRSREHSERKGKDIDSHSERVFIQWDCIPSDGSYESKRADSDSHSTTTLASTGDSKEDTTTDDGEDHVYYKGSP